MVIIRVRRRFWGLIFGGVNGRTLRDNIIDAYRFIMDTVEKQKGDAYIRINNSSL